MRNDGGWLCALAAALIGASVLPSCTVKPVVLSNEFQPPGNSVLLTPDAKAASGPVCRIRFALTDERIDPQSMGDVGAPIRADAMAWLRSGFAYLGRDPRLRIVEQDPTDLNLDVHLLKAYVQVTLTEASSNVSLQVHYTRDGSDLGTRVYRGTDLGFQWSDGREATQRKLNAALNGALYDLRQDVLTRCQR